MQIAKAFFLNTKKLGISLIIYLVVFITLMVLMSRNGRSQETSFESSRMDIIVQDLDQSELSHSLAQYLSQEHEVLKNNYTAEQIADELYYENIDYVLTIPKGFEKNLEQGKTKHLLKNRKIPGSTTGYFLDEQINQYLSVLCSYIVSGYSDSDAASFAQKAVQQKTDINIVTDKKTLEESELLYNAFLYLPYILICILMSGLGMILITFRDKNLHTRIQCSSLSVTKRNIQLAISSIFFSLICWGILLLINSLTTSSNFFNIQGLFYIMNSFTFLLVAVSITFLVSFLVRSFSTLNMVANVVGLGLSFLGGVFVPLQHMDSSVVMFSKLLPSYWYIIALDYISGYSGKSSQIQSLLFSMGIETLFAVAIFCAALVASRQKKYA